MSALAGAADAPEHPLARWRRVRGWSSRAAARRLRISPDAVEAIEAGTMEPGPALMIDVWQRTDGVVWLGEGETPDTPAAADAPTPADDDTATWWARPIAGRGPDVWLRRQHGQVDDSWTLDPKAAADLGMQLIRAALIANRLPGDA